MQKEAKIIIALNALKKIMTIFLGPFLTAYFIKTSTDSLKLLSIYYAFSCFVVGTVSFIVGRIIKNKFRVGMFRIGVIINFIYIMMIIILKHDIINHLCLMSILFGISSATYFFPFNLFIMDKVDNSQRSLYFVKSKVLTSTINVVFPILLGSMITITNYELTATIILLVSLIQIILSFYLKPEHKNNFIKYDLIKTIKKIKSDRHVKKIFLVSFLTGMNISDGALEILKTILIFNSFKTDLKLGIITSAATIISMIVVKIYGKIYTNKNDKIAILLSGIIPVLSMLVFIVFKNNLSLIIYNICYVSFTSLLTVTIEIRLFNITGCSAINENNQVEYWSIREGFLALGRIISYIMLMIVGIFYSDTLLNIITILLTLSIFIVSMITTQVDKFDN